jgi:hypothetical protein
LIIYNFLLKPPSMKVGGVFMGGLGEEGKTWKKITKKF